MRYNMPLHVRVGRACCGWSLIKRCLSLVFSGCRDCFSFHLRFSGHSAPLDNMSRSFVLSLACAALATAQSSATLSIAPAVETVTASTPANVPLFSIESIQLTDKVVSGLQDNPDVAEFASLFNFGDANTTADARSRQTRSVQRCKTMPGDALYPSKLLWSVFDLLSGGALEPIVPIGSPCYPNSAYKNYNAERCAFLVKNYDQEEI